MKLQVLIDGQWQTFHDAEAIALRTVRDDGSRIHEISYSESETKEVTHNEAACTRNLDLHYQAGGYYGGGYVTVPAGSVVNGGFPAGGGGGGTRPGIRAEGGGGSAGKHEH